MNIADLIGNTPLVDLSPLVGKKDVQVFGKLEGNNPGGSVKDRPAKWMIKNAIERGDIKKGMRLIEPTSGNTGIALAMLARAYGLEIELVMPENSTAERVQTMQAFGAKVVLTSAQGSMEECIDYARAKVKEGGYVMLDQFANPDNWLAHYESTGPEIWRDTKGSITHFVSSMGTTGTIMGSSRFFKEKNAAIQIVGVQPMDGAKIPGIRRWPEAYLPKIYEKDRIDRIVDVGQVDSENMARSLARDAGAFVGVSSGGAAFAAQTIASEIDRGVIVVILCDRGDRYLSSNIFEEAKS